MDKEKLENSETLLAPTRDPGAASPSTNAETGVLPQEASSCPTCGAAATSSAPRRYVYALGRIEARFPSLAVEKEFTQALGRSDTAGLADRQALHSALSKPENRYLARQVCWVFTVRGIEAYILVPRDFSELDLLIQALRPHPAPMDIDVIIGTVGPIAPPEMCNALMVPIVIFDQIYSFDRNSMIKAIPRPEKGDKTRFEAAAEEVFDRIVQMTENFGATNENRALNYLAVRYHAIYANAAEAFAREFSLSAVETRPSSLTNTRNVVDVIFAFTNRTTDFVEKVFVRVDVTEEFPFLVTKLSPYYDR